MGRRNDSNHTRNYELMAEASTATNEPQSRIESYCTVVHERPLCIWSRDLHKDNLEFLDSLDPTHFEYLARTFVDDLEGSDDKHASVALRMAYSQGLEALFGLLCATVQAPACISAWLLSYKIVDLEEVVRCINQERAVLNDIGLEKSSWRAVSRFIHQFVPFEPPDRYQSVVEGFASLWRMFAVDFLNEHVRDEYNSIKHGFRVTLGGFTLKVGIEHEPGVSPPPDEMKTVAASRYGTLYPYAVRIQGDRANIFLLSRARNWSPIDMAKGLRLVSNSMRNVIACLKVLNGVPPDKVQFSWPADGNEFQAPWANRASFNNASFDIAPLPESQLQLKTNDQILDQVKERHTQRVAAAKLNDTSGSASSTGASS